MESDIPVELYPGWGVAIPAAIFNNRFGQLSYRILDPQARSLFDHGDAYQLANADYIGTFAPTTQDQIIGVYTDALKQVWEIGIVFSGVSFLLVFLEKEIKLRTELDTEYGLEKEKKQADAEASKAVGTESKTDKPENAVGE